ncbi:MAG: nuclear transport factor 2 family protein [Rhodothermia bacterium]|nr:nuclear transport factor 2 family protein [Rhodothermia bacterium]
MSTVNEAERLALAWIEGWIRGTPDEIPLAARFTHSSPFGVVAGREKYLEWVKPLAAKNVASLKILRTVGSETEAAIWFEMTTPQGTIPCCDWVQVKNGEIVAVNSFYDATDLR